MFIKGYKLASPGSLVALLCFFLPWMLLSCNGQAVDEFSGAELASGAVVDTMLGSQPIDAMPMLWLIPIACLCVLLLAFLAGRRGTIAGADKILTFLLGLLPFVYLVLTIINMISSPELQEARQQGVSLTARFGLWGTLLGMLLVTIGAVMNWFGAKAVSTEASSGSVSPAGQ